MFTKDKYGFWKQDNPRIFKYTADYKARQATTEAMAFLRLGWLGATYPPDVLRTMTAVDIGCGTRCFINNCRSYFKELKGFDLKGRSISEEELRHTRWSLVILSDVLEHYREIDELFTLNWDAAFLSFPETPPVSKWEDLRKWRHFKPDEHIWMLNTVGMYKWATDRGAEVIDSSFVEDFIRRPQPGLARNIASMLIRR